MEMVPTASRTNTDLNATIQKVLEQTGIDLWAYEKYMMRKYSNASLNVL